MSGHTSGPWVPNIFEEDFFTIEANDGIALAEAYSAADARLIAAAPDLLEALKAIRMARDMGLPVGEILAPGSVISVAVDAAIAKAEGKQQHNTQEERT